MSLLDKWPAAKSMASSAAGMISGNFGGVLGGLAGGILDKPAAGKQGTSTDPALSNRDYTVIITQAQELPPGPAKVIVGSMPESLQIEQSSEYSVPWGAGLAGEGTLGNIAGIAGNRLIGHVMTMKVWQGAGNDFSFTVAFELRAWSDPAKDVLQPLRDLLSMTLPTVDANGFLLSPGPVMDAAAAAQAGQQVVAAATSAVEYAKNAINQVTSGSGSASFDSILKSATDPASLKSISATMSSVTSGAQSSATKDGAFAPLAGASNSTPASKAADQTGLFSKAALEKNIKNKINIQIGRWFAMDNVLVTNVQHDIKPQTPDRRTGLFQSASVVVTFTPMFALTVADIDKLLGAGAAASVSSRADVPKLSSSMDARDLVRGSRGYNEVPQVAQDARDLIRGARGY